jgi:hypothetical protein
MSSPESGGSYRKQSRERSFLTNFDGLVGSLSFSGLLILSILGLSLLPTTNLHALESMSENEMSDVDASEGFAIDVDLDVVIDDITFTDGDGTTGTAGVIQLGSGSGGVTLDNGSGGAADLNGFTVDADGDGLSSNAGAIVFGGPTGTFTFASDQVILGGGSSAFQMDVNGIDVSNTTVQVGAN